MAIVYRLQKPKYNTTVLSGEGASVAGGRWNTKGVPVVYTSSTISLTVLEMQVHIDRSQVSILPKSNIIELLVPDEYIHEFGLADLPADWDSNPVTESVQQFLAQYLEPGHKLAFKVPSVVNPYEYNLLINPLHTDIKHVLIMSILDFTFDPRLFVKA